jgi:hypothetical protein
MGYNALVKDKNMQVAAGQSERTWRNLYLAALFESDSAKLPERIAEAEYALGLRDRELWYSGGDHNGEQHGLTGPRRALEALRYIHQ